MYFEDGDEEVARAVYNGFVPASLQKDLSKQITYKEFASMLSLMIAKVNAKLVPTWAKTAVLALKSDRKMLRQDGMLATLYAAEVIGYDKYNSIDIQFNDDSLWNGFKWNYPEFPNWNKNRKLTLEAGGFSDSWDNYALAAMFFSVRRISSYNSKPLFEYDKKTLRAETSLTRRDAIKAVARLFDSRGVYPAEKMVPINSVSTYDKEIITDSLLRKAQNIPEPTLEKLPYYTGFCLQDKSGYWGSKDAHWKEKDVQMVAEWGFNYLRVKADSLFFSITILQRLTKISLKSLTAL
jgi:hypothetical protein